MDSHPLNSAIVSCLPGKGLYERYCPKTSRSVTNSTLISGTIFWTMRTRLQAYIPLCTENGRWLESNLFVTLL